MKRHLLLAVLTASALLGACAKESSLPNPQGDGTVRAINAIPGSPEVSFLIEARLIGATGYKGVTNQTIWDALDYTFNFNVVLAGDTSSTRVASQPLSVARDMDYTFMISGALNAPDVTVFEAPRRTFDANDTVFEVRFSHLAETLGAVDVYLADETVPPALGSQAATVSFGEMAAPIDFPEGDYVLTITPAGDDTTVLFVAGPVTFAARSSLLINVFDGDENDIAPLAVRTLNTVVGGSGAALVDSRFPPTFRFFHASPDMATADIYLDDPLTTPVVADHAYRDITGPIDVMSGDIPVTYTEAMNIGNILIDNDETVFSGARYDLYVINDLNGNDRLITTIADRQSIQTFARISVINTAVGRDSLDVYVAPTGTPVDDDLFPLYSGLPRGTSPIQIPINAGDYEIHVTDNGEKTLLAGPIPLNALNGDVFEVILYDNVDPNIIDVVFIP